MESYNLTKSQKLIYDMDSYVQGSVATITGRILFNDKIDIQSMKQAINYLIKDNDSLRINIVNNNGKVVQSISEYIYEDIQVKNFASEKEIDEFAQNEAEKRFELDGKLYNIVIIYNENCDKYSVLMSISHCIGDAWSMYLLKNTLIDYYNTCYNSKEIESKTFSYVNYIKKELIYMEGKRYEKDKLYWIDEFYDYDSDNSILLFEDNPNSFKSNRSVKELNNEETKTINELSLELKTSPFVLMLSVISAYFSLAGRKDDFCIGTALFNRQDFQDMNTVGMFVNTIPLRIKIDKSICFNEMVNLINIKSFSNMKHQRFNYGELLDVLEETSRGGSLYNITFTYQITPKGTKRNNTKWYHCGNQTSTLAITLINNDENYELIYDYKIDCISKSDIDFLHDRLINILNIVSKKQTIVINDLDIVTEAEKNIIINEFNNTSLIYDKNKTIVDLFEEQVKKNPNKIAIVFENKKLTYCELNKKANAVANKLIQLGVKPEDYVAIMTEKSIQSIVGIYGILKSGAAYVPIDSSYPYERIQYIINDCNPKAVIIYNCALETEIPIINLNDDTIFDDNSENPEKKNKPYDVAYCIYTSGTTGKPKGVIVEHHGVVNLKKYFETDLKINFDDKILQFANYTFDASVWEINMALLNGASLYIASQELISDTSAFENYFNENKITVVTLPPNYMLQVSKIKPRLLITAGSESNMKVINSSKGEYINAYGPTEATVCATSWKYEKNTEIKRIPIGKPICNTQVYVMIDKKLCGIGIPGELCISGDGISRGYLNMEELTLEKFIDNPFGKGKLYRTGDLAKFTESGNIEYLGRIDEQVKIRGFRIELSEIENSLRNIAGIKDCAVIAKKDKNGEKDIYAYVVSNNDITLSEIKSILKQSLPNYMIPSYIMKIDKIPITINGKVDRRSLPEILNYSNEDYIEPRNNTEQIICKLFSEILNVEKIGIKDNFFDMGGHSLRAMRLINNINSEFRCSISLKDIFTNPTPELIALLIKSCNKNDFNHIPKADEKQFYPMSSPQKRIYLICQLNNKNISYNMPQSLRLKGNVDKVKIKNVLEKIISRHEILRTKFLIIDGQPVQKILDFAEVNFEYDEDDKTEEKKLIDEFVKPFDLSKPPLIRVKLVKRALEEYILMFDMHHIVSDGMSMSNFIKEFTELYDGKELEEMSLQYKDYSEWMQKYDFSKEKSYWLNEFSDSIPVLDMPLDFARCQEQSYNGAISNLNIGKQIGKGIKLLARKTNTTEYMVFLSALSILLSKYSCQDDIVIGCLVSGRTHKDTENMLGMFVNTLAIRTNPEGEKHYDDFLQIIREKSLKSFENQGYPFEDLVDLLNVQRDLSRNPLFDVIFVMQNNEKSILQMDKVTIENAEQQRTVARTDLTFNVEEEDDDFNICLEYCTDLFKAETVERMLVHLREILCQIINNPHIFIKDIAAISETEKSLIMNDFNNTDKEYPIDKTVIDLFEEQVRKTPNNIAVVYGDTSITFRELNEKSNALAYMLREKNIMPDTFVGVVANRSIEMIIAIYGIMKAGGAYVPIDPSYPADRVTYMIEDSRISVLLCCHADIDCGKEIEKINITDYNKIKSISENPPHVNTPKDLLYLIYTSGTTGTPKGVMCHHTGLINRILWMNSKYALNKEDVILQKTTFTFDVSVWEIFWWGFIGCKVIMLKQGDEKDPIAICETIEKYKVTTIHFVPSMLNMFLTSLEGHLDNCKKLSSLKYVFASGEALLPIHTKLFKKLVIDTGNKARLINFYGPTEASIDVTYYNTTGTEKIVPIGKPIDNIKLFILNNGTLCGIGVPGELCITGVGVERGYLNKEELTLQKFVDNPFGKGKMYYTGDLVKWMPDGNIEYVGRIDEQVKIRGFRIELGEIASAINSIKNVKDCAVIVRTDKSGDKNICAYFVADTEIEENFIKNEIGKYLPHYMIPSYIMQIKNIPVTSNGKLNKRALPEINFKRNKEYVVARNEMEKTLVKVYERILGIDNVSVIDNFFDIGGNSLKLVSVFNDIDKIYPGTIKIVDIFSHPTIESMAQFITQQMNAKINKLEIDGIELPSEYFNITDYFEGQDDDSFIVKLNDEQSVKIFKFAEETKCEVHEIILAVYAFVLMKCCEVSDISIQCAVDEINEIKQIKIDISEIENFVYIIELVKKLLDETNLKYSFDNYVKKPNEGKIIFPLFVCNSLNQNYSEFFDLILSVNKNSENRFEIECTFNSDILNRDLIGDMFFNCINIINTIINS